MMIKTKCVLALSGLFFLIQNSNATPTIENTSDHMVFSYTADTKLDLNSTAAKITKGQVFLTNSASEKLQISNITLKDAPTDGKIEINRETCGAIVDPGKTCNFSYVYTASATPVSKKNTFGQNLELKINYQEGAAKPQILAYPLQAFHINKGNFITLPQNTPHYHELGDITTEGVFVDAAGTIYIATDNGLSVSRDGGQTVVTYTTAQGLICNFTTGVYAAGDDIYVTTTRGLSISHDRGANWTSYNLHQTAGVYVTQSNGKKIIYVATAINGLLFSMDDGVSWKSYTSTTKGFGSNRVLGIYTSNDGQYIYAATDGGVSISKDYGKTWQTFNAQIPEFGVDLVRGVYASANNLKILAATNAGVRISTNGGKNWTASTTEQGLGDDSVYGVFANADGSVVYAATNGGLSISKDLGTSWKNYEATIGDRWVYGVFVSEMHNKNTIYAATFQGLSISDDMGANWRTLITKMNNNNSSVKISPQGKDIYVGTTNHGVFISHDFGLSWKNYTKPDLGDSKVSDVYVSPDGSLIYVATNGGGLSIRNEQTQKWTIYSAAQGRGLTDDNVDTVYASSNGQYIYLGTDNGLFVSSDRGENWKNLLNLPKQEVYAIYADSSNMRLYVATYKGLYVSHDGGLTWAIYNGLTPGFAGNVVTRIQVSPDEKTIYAGTNQGLSVGTVDGSDVFWKINQKLRYSGVQALYVSPNGENWYVGTCLFNPVEGLSISRDRGDTWATFPMSPYGLSSDSVFDLYPTSDEKNLYVATSESISYSAF